MNKILLPFDIQCVEAGVDEAGRGCLAGDVVAAAVILPLDYFNSQINDSKVLTPKQREKLRYVLEQEAIDWAIGSCSPKEIDEINILQASILAMHRALDGLKTRPEHIIVDGNKFKPYNQVPHRTIVKGDGKYLSIAAASIFAKTERDSRMIQLASEYPLYDWATNKGYPTKKHRQAIAENGLTPFHRVTFKVK